MDQATKEAIQKDYEKLTSFNNKELQMLANKYHISLDDLVGIIEL